MASVNRHGMISDSCYYYGANGNSGVVADVGQMFSRDVCASDNAEARSPLAATRANSGASAASPIGTASCMKVESSPLLE